jgi:hypothetical protein
VEILCIPEVAKGDFCPEMCELGDEPKKHLTSYILPRKMARMLMPLFTRRCALPECGVEFQTDNPRKLHCSRKHTELHQVRKYRARRKKGGDGGGDGGGGRPPRKKGGDGGDDGGGGRPHGIIVPKDARACGNGALIAPSLRRVVRRKPVAFRPHVSEPDYLLCYCVEILDCGHTVNTYPQADNLVAVRRRCSCCDEIPARKSVQLKSAQRQIA